VDEKRRHRRTKKSGETSKGPANGSASAHSDSRSTASNGDAGSSSHQSSAEGSHATHSTHATHASPASSNKDDKNFSPAGSPHRSNSNLPPHSDHRSRGSRRSSASSARRSSGSKRAPSEPKSDNISTRSKDDVHVEPSSPQPTHRSMSSRASDKSHSDTPSHIPQQPISVNKSQKSSTKTSRSKLHKRRRTSSDSPDDVDPESVHLPSSEGDIADEPLLRDYVHIIKSDDMPTEENGNGMSDIPVDDEGNLEPALRPIETPRSSSNEWIFPLELSLEELFNGTSLRFRVTRRLLSRNTKQTMVAIDIPSGTLAGTKIRCAGAGHQRRDNTFQDVVFVVEEKPHDRFTRVKDNLFLDVFVPYVDQLAEDGGDICLEGIGAENITINIPYPIDQKSTDGDVIVKGGGMPSRKGGRGDLIVRCVVLIQFHVLRYETINLMMIMLQYRWQVVFPSTTSKWGLFKKVFHMHH
jgi:hypothetical protein